ncbi:MAG: Gfo/Idh/MocA family oxidoreductase [Myxococcales bacterium]|nr:Gfo/Idh/MocA family oxidoreductase [Myxococcales bacterium]
MKQILQDARSGDLELAEVPAPQPGPGEVLVRNAFSVVSPGTEKMAIDFARKSLLGKARSRPDLVKQVTRKLRQEGPIPTWRAVTTRLAAPQPLGYSCAGVVESVGEEVGGFAPGDRVACAGAGYANHAEFVVVPENLVARVPDAVDLEHAAYATVGAVAMQGLRVANPSLGEVGVTIGLGLIGQLAVQLLRANGCRVLGIDLDPKRVEQALEQGAEWGAAPDAVPPGWKDAATAGFGADFAVVTASASSSAPIELAAELCRMRGRIALVGAMPLELDRRSFYDKELELRMSMSYGPGRYARRYEEEGCDYPLPFVRWTENRNLQSFLSLLASGALHIDRLDADVVPFEDALRSYDELARGERRSLSVVYRYAGGASLQRTLPLSATLQTEKQKRTRETVGIAFLGAGNYAKSVLLPALGSCRSARPVTLVTQTGASARRASEQFGFDRCGTDPRDAFDSAEIDLVFVTTRHDTHAELAAQALRAGKAVWLEKPAALSPAELAALLEAAKESGSFLTLGYNRRFSTHAREVRAAFAERQGPLAVHYAVAAGPTPAGTWLTDPKVGGGRIVGEVCHFVDLCAYLVGTSPETVYARALGRDPERDDSLVANLGFRDGSTATIEYLATAHPDLPKERFEVSGSGGTARCENFRVTQIRGGKTHKTLNQDKGQTAAVSEVVALVKSGGASPFALDEIAAVSRATFAMEESVRTGNAVRLHS